MKMREIFLVSLLLMSVSVDGATLLSSSAQTATQNNMGWNGAPSRAIDGRTSGTWGDGTCTHSSTSSNNWWQLDLGKVQKVTSVTIYNREDCCQSRINGAKVYVGEMFCGEVVWVSGKSVYNVECTNGGIYGTFVKVIQNNDYLTLCEVKVYGVDESGVSLNNIAPGHTASQNSEGWSGNPYRAIDGKVNGIWSHGSCTHSAGASNNWWKVQLIDSYLVDTVVVHNREDCCQDRINGAKVYVGDTLCGTITYVTGQRVYPVECNAVGSQVKIVQNGNYLTLCEVQIMSPPASTDDVEDRGDLLSQGKVASQNNVGWSGVASRAVDGETSGTWGDGTCTHTSSSSSNWWQVDLGQTATVEIIKIYNRADCCQSRIGGAKVYVGDVYCGTVTYETGRSVYMLDCNGIFGSTVKVVQNQQYLTLCEVEVYGSFTNEGVLLKNIASGHDATQNTVAHSGEPYRAIDGRTNGIWGHGTCTHSSGSSGNWWQVDLVDSYVIDSVVVHNRQDCCQNRINGATVYVDGVSCGVISYVTGQNVYPISCKTEGSVVKIVQNSNILTLCEVEILAPATSVDDVEEERGELLSLNKPTTSNSVSHDGAPARAVDGTTSGQWGDGSCTHSSGGSNNWWKVDLEATAKVDTIKIYNRQDCCEDRISAAKVFVGDEFCDEITYSAGQPVYVLDCGGIVGDSVTVVQNDNILTLCEVEVYGELEDGDPLKNIAPGLETTQNSVGWSGVPARAIDNRVNGIWSHGSCTHSAGVTDNWWAIDLLDNYNVQIVVIHNRQDCCQDRINGAQIFVDDELCGMVRYVSGKNVYKVACESVLSGSTVKVVQADNYLTLCEVQILVSESNVNEVEDSFGDLLTTGSGVLASQNNVGWSGVASRAIDGETSGTWSDGTCTHSSSTSGNWWKVNLGVRSSVERVVIYNRADCCQSRLDMVQVYVGEEYCGEVNYQDSQSEFTIDCDGKVGREVIVVGNYNYLTLCEVEVYGRHSATEGVVMKNIAVGLSTSQSSVAHSGESGRAVDGKTSGSWGHGTCTHTNGNGPHWWKVNLFESYQISAVVIHNRIDCCSDRIDGVQVFVGDSLCGTVTYDADTTVYTVTCSEPIEGSEVSVTREDGVLTLCEVEILATEAAVSEVENSLGTLLSQGQTATQNNVGWSGVASRANDGRTSGTWSDGTCQHSSTSTNNWWKVDLGAVSAVERVVVYNRLDCCKDRINRAKIYVGEEYCGEVLYLPSQQEYNIDCNGTVGSSVTVVQNDNYLTLCEVQVYGTPSEDTPLKNVAPGHPSSQNSVGWGGAPARANDGMVNGQWGHGSCSHSAGASDNWWLLDLVDDYEIQKVVIHNRVDCCQNRIDGAVVLIDGNVCGVVEYVEGQNVYPITCEVLMTGSEVKIEQLSNYLTLCEVEVMVTESSVTTNEGSLLSSGKSTSQNSVGWSGVSSRAVDGRTSGTWSDGTCTHSAGTSNNYWRVDLGEVAAVSMVKIYNRQDCCQSRIGGAKVYVGEQFCGEITYKADQDTFILNCEEAAGDYVKIINNDNYLTLCEVEVLGAVSDATPLRNIAAGHATDQNSVGWRGISNRAVDGRVNGQWGDASCTHSATAAAGNWWSVDFVDEFDVKMVVVHNRRDCCQDRINGAKVYAGGELCGTIEYVANQFVYPLSCNDATASNVTIVQVEASYLTLCEVEVLVDEDEYLDQLGDIISQHKGTEQNSVGWSGVSGRAVDGYTSGTWGDGTCTHSAGSSNNWWKVQLGGDYSVSRVEIYNRQDCCQDRIHGAKVYVGDLFCGEVVYSANQVVFTIQCNDYIGSEVRIIQDDNILTLCEVNVYGDAVTTEQEGLSNIAPGHPTSQSSVGWNGIASRAIDGGLNGRWGDASCTHSASSSSNWWKLDLAMNFDVETVVIHNRKDCCQNRIDGVQVYAEDTLCGTISYDASVNVYQVDCPAGTVASYIMVRQSDNYLTLCEVEVLGTESDEVTVFKNVATGGRASQSSTGSDGIASRAIDGHTNGDYFDGSCTHTASFTSQWWKLQLDVEVLVDHIVLYNRQDCCANRINGAVVKVGDEVCGTVSYVEGQTVYKLECSTTDSVPKIGSVITIEGVDAQPLTICEVMVMTNPSVSIDDVLTNLAYKKPAIQSSIGWSGGAGRAVDGRLSGKWSDGTCTHTAGTGYWEVDLMGNYNVENVVIFNREDCCANRLRVTVYVGDVSCGEVNYVSGTRVYTIDCGVVGNKVRIVNSFSYLTLCEVQVMGRNEIVTSGDTTEVIANASATADDAKSVAACPDGYTVSSCFVDTLDFRTGSDGLTLENSGKSCVAHSSWQKAAVVARAICTATEQTDNPCGGDSLSSFTYSAVRNGEAACPAGYNRVGCFAHSYWAPADQYTALDAYNTLGQLSDSSGSCSAVCTDSNYCTATAICMLEVDSTEYMSNVCPTCSGYTCDEGADCAMVNGTHTCVIIQTGCDEDKCGDYGDCSPEGAAGYTCDCEDGYIYNEYIGTCIIQNTKWTIVTGTEASGNDAVSSAQCPDDMSVMRCHTYGVTGSADGVTVSGAGGLCEARAAHAGDHPIRAIAYCGSITHMSDPCTGDVIGSTEYRYVSAKSPSITCPNGYVMSSCIFWSPWTEYMTDSPKAYLDSIGSVNIVDGVCAVPDCVDGDSRWCRLTAFCTKVTGDHYIELACPTCEQVKCEEGFECELSSKTTLPVCNEYIPGGCDVDRCGDNGECIELGVNYTCSCDSGYEYDDITCTDVNECTENPCGNGECTNLNGTYHCECMSGYEIVDGTCIDEDECSSGSHDCSDTERCSNIEGSYICDCLDTFYLLDEECVCATGYNNDGDECVDTDECTDDPCLENEDCTNTVGGYSCDCTEGYEHGPDDVCRKYKKSSDCGITAKKDIYSAFEGNNINVKLDGELKSTFKNYATIVWKKDGELFDPAEEGKEKWRGFKIIGFEPENAGRYVGSIFIDKPDELLKCEVEVTLELTEGSATIEINNPEKLSEDLKSGRTFNIQCKLKLTNVDVEDGSDPDNVDWYKVNPDEGVEKLEHDEDGDFGINKSGGVYKLFFRNPQPEHSGTYRCEFNHDSISVNVEVMINIV